MNRIKLLKFTAVLLVFASLVSCGTFGGNDVQTAELSLDPAVRSGILENGVKWYIRPNSEPEQRASLRLVVDAGSILEEEDQRGLAHFCEHMAFNGTENFQKSELVDYLESIGMAFGPEINAYTSFDETVYMLEIPTDDDEIISNAFLVLEDWAHRVSYEDEEIEKERGVILEEWRLGRGASGRIRDRLIETLFKGSRYAERLPIGLVDVIENAPPQRLRDFYEKWYRPELMSVVVVGDIDPDQAERLIEKHFSFEAPKQTVSRPVYSLPEAAGTEILTIEDPELSYASVEVRARVEHRVARTEAEFRDVIVRQLLWTMFNDRLDEIAKRQNPPYIGAGGGLGSLVRGSSSAACYASADTDGALAALEALLIELRRAEAFGFSEGELERKKISFLDSVEEYYVERENIPSSSLAGSLVDYSLGGTALPGVETEYELYNRFIPGISLGEINSLAESLLPDNGRIISMIYPEGSDTASDDEIHQLIEMIDSAELEPWVDDTLDRELLSKEPAAGSIISKTVLEEIDSEIWSLSNGATVVVKKTDFKEDEILFSAYSQGGLSLESDEDYISGRYAPLLAAQSGLGEFNSIQLQKKLAGLGLSISPYITGAGEGISGSFSPDELEVFMKLMHMYFTEPRFDDNVLLNLKSRLASVIENRLSNPMNVYSDKLTEILTQNDFRSRPLDEAGLLQYVRERAERVWRSRFSGGGDFVFVFTGNLDVSDMEKAVEKYIASLPEGRTSEMPADRGVRPPEGIIDETVVKGIEPQGQVSIYFTGELPSYDADFDLQTEISASVLQTLLREKIREELSGTYGISVTASVSRTPYTAYRLGIAFGCDPQRVDELTDAIFSLIDEVLRGNLDEDYIGRQQQKYLRSYEEAVELNSFWLNHLEDAVIWGEDPRDILEPDEFDELITVESVTAALRRLIDTENYIRVVLKPEN